MGVLSGKEIRRRLALRGEDSIVVSPLLEPDEQVRKDQASLDVRLGFTFALVLPSTYGAIDEFDARSQDEIRRIIAAHYKTEYIPFGGKIVIHPHQFILASSLEYVRLPSNLMAQVVGRSTWGRLGLIVATAIGVHPHFAGTLTLELRNLGEAPLVLHPGQSIAQIFFHTVEDPPKTSKEIGQYSGTVDLLPRHMSSPVTYQRIRSYIEARFVRDIMRKGNNVPLVDVGTKMSEAVLEMTAKRLGCVGVTDQTGSLVGIITDGDLRRYMHPRFFDDPVDKVMNIEPKTIRPGQLASEALQLLHASQISVLIVVENERPVGVVHLHDLTDLN